MATKTPDRLADFELRPKTFGGKERAVYYKGDGPAVIVISEVPGITPEVADFARRVADAGFTAVMPHLFGDPGRPFGNAYSVQTLGWACISREFTAFARGKTSPVTNWLRRLAADAHGECGGPGVGVIGMCLTGGFALAMMVDETVMAPVLSQPSLPFPVSRKHKSDLGIPDADLDRVKARVDDGVCVLGLRFSNDPISPGERFARLRDELGDGFIGVEIDSGPGNPHGFARTAHSVVSEEYRDEPGHPTYEAMQQVIDHFRKYLMD